MNKDQNKEPKNGGKKAPSSLTAGVLEQHFSAGVFSGVVSSLSFKTDDTMQIYISEGSEKGYTATEKYTTRDVSKKTVLIGYVDSHNATCVVSAYNFDTKKVFAFVYANGAMSTSKGTFTWTKH